MADTIRELIQKNIDTTLKGIKTSAGYNNDFVSVQRYMQKKNSFARMPMIIHSAGDESVASGPHPWNTLTLPVIIAIYFRYSEITDGRSVDEVINSYLGDVVKALMADITRGGNAERTEVTSIPIFENDEKESLTGVFIEIEVTYYHQATNPYSR